MKVLDLIRYIAQHKEITCVVFQDSYYTSLEMINYLASIDPSHYDDYKFFETHKKDDPKYILTVYQE